jgi:uncharacterized membrane protein YqhA
MGGAAPLPVRWLFLGARLLMLIGVLALIVTAATLLIFGAVGTFRHIALLVGPAGADLTNREVFLACIKLLDLVLLATVLLVAAIGLYSLFIDRNIPVPRWLQTEGVDGLKNQLAGIVVTLLGVLYLEQVITSAGSPDVMPLGIGIAAVILALCYFIRSHPSEH